MLLNKTQNNKPSNNPDRNTIEIKRQKEREKKIIKTLQCFQIEQEEFRVALKKLLSKGEGVKDLRIMLKSLRIRQSDRDTELIKMLEEFEVVKGRVQTQWQAVSRVSG